MGWTVFVFSLSVLIQQAVIALMAILIEQLFCGQNETIGLISF